MGRKKKEETGKEEAGKEEFPNIEFNIDVFSQQQESKKELRKRIEEKIKKIGEKFIETETEELKEKLEKERKTLVPLEDYIKYGVYIGTKAIVPHIKPFIYRRRNDGIAILNINSIDEKLKKFIKNIIKYKPEDFIIVCKREAGWKAVKKFSEMLGIRAFTKKYPAGILTNTKLPSFFETEAVFVVDPWIDRNAMKDAKKIKKEVFSLCDTNNYTFDVDFFVPCNNKSDKSIGLILYVIAREYLKAHKIEKEIKLSDFVEEV